MAVPKVVVWERCNKIGKWCPYSGAVSQLLEKCYKNLESVCLGDVEDALKIYSVDFKNMVQVSEVTGTKSAIRRQLYDDPVLERGFVWQWQSDNDWQPYDVEVNRVVECAFLEGKKTVNLHREFHQYNYLIDFTKMLQINKRTKRKRSVRRTKSESPYPLTNSDLPHSDLKGTDNISSNNLNEMRTLMPNIEQEVPGTAALEAQVNQYMRNVSGRGPTETSQNKKLKFDEAETMTVETDGTKSELEPKSSPSVGSTAALVNGRPWYEPWPPHTPRSKLKPVPGIEELPKFKKTKGGKKNKGEEMMNVVSESVGVIDQYTEKIEMLPAASADQTCIICCEVLSGPSSYDGSTTVVKLLSCAHLFHKACLDAMYDSGPKEKFLQCPTCKKIQGEKCGIQPPGNMVYHVIPYSLPGYHEHDTIRIIYDIPSGIQGPDHPRPGKRYSARGFPRHCYLPDNEQGRKVLRLLVKAWQRRLIFTIGRSSTTGEENTVTWNEIHHKTEFGCNRRGHGFPDPNYFHNVLAELEAHGVTDDQVYEWCPV